MGTISKRLIIASAILLLQGMPSAMAQEGVSPSAQENSTREDKVKYDLFTPADRSDKEVYLRTITPAADGSHAVVVRDKEGRIRMTGSFVDEDLQEAEGLFTFYYPNGVVESRGEYVNGLKSGLWERYQFDGTRKADRIYTGKTWEELINEPDDEAARTDPDQ